MNIRKQSPIATAIGVLVVGAPLVLIALAFPETTKNVLLDVTLWIAGGVLWMGLFESRGYRNLVIGLFFLPISFFAFRELVGDLVTALAATVFAGWLVIGLIRKSPLQTGIAKYLAGVGVTCIGLAGVLLPLEPDNKVHAALALMVAAGLYLVWRNCPKALASPRASDPWRWSRDKDGNWRA